MLFGKVSFYLMRFIQMFLVKTFVVKILFGWIFNIVFQASSYSQVI
jgi:hypothetical protein